MASYYDRDEEDYGSRDYGRRRYGNRHEGRYSGHTEDRGWTPGTGDPGRFGSGNPDDYERGYTSQPYTGDEQGRGFAGSRDFGRAYRAGYDRDWGGARESEREYSRPYGPSGSGQRYSAGPQYSERHYEGTFRPPDYGRDFQDRRYRTYRGEGLAGDRDWLDRASDEVSSWFGDQAAERRRRMDKMKTGEHRGRGPKGYRRSDERIKEDINDRLTDYAYLDASEIVVSVKEAEVTLDGTVIERADKRLAEDIAESVSGVRNVQNNLRIKEEQISGAGLETSAKAAAR